MSPQAEILFNKVICKEPGRYMGWPTIVRTRAGELIVVFSGDLDGHLCPLISPDQLAIPIKQFAAVVTQSLYPLVGPPWIARVSSRFASRRGAAISRICACAAASSTWWR
jgi:hypothetical protein